MDFMRIVSSELIRFHIVQFFMGYYFPFEIDSLMFGWLFKSPVSRSLELFPYDFYDAHDPLWLDWPRSPPENQLYSLYYSAFFFFANDYNPVGCAQNNIGYPVPPASVHKFLISRKNYPLASNNGNSHGLLLINFYENYIRD